MKFIETAIAGAWIVEIDPHQDERGFFARTWCADDFAQVGLATELAQCSISFNPLLGTLRGLHDQGEPHAESKLIRCTRGAIFDVGVDLRPDSSTYLRHVAVELDWRSRNGLFLPAGIAHGFLTLRSDTEVFYQISTRYVPEAQRGFRWNDPAFSIPWPATPILMSERDRSLPDYRPGPLG